MSDCRVPMPVYEKPNNVREIVEQYLKENGYDGLYNEIGECGCPCDDLMPCDNGGMYECEPAIQHYCPCCGESVFMPVSSLVELCQKWDEKQKATLADLFGIFADKAAQTAFIDDGK